LANSYANLCIAIDPPLLGNAKEEKVQTEEK
jgi:hypothetical protein